MTETEVQFLDRCKRILADRSEKEALINVLEETNKRGIHNSHTLAWTILSKLRYPIANLSPTGTSPISILDANYNKSPITEEEAAEQEAELDEFSEELETLVKDHSPEASVYMHLASIRFSQQHTQKAQRILREGLEHAEEASIIALYYCENLQRTQPNVARHEELLCSLLGNDNLHVHTHNYARELLITLYLELSEYTKVASLLNTYALNRPPETLLEALASFCISQEGALCPAPDDLIDWLATENERFFDKAPKEITPATDLIVEYRYEMTMPTLYAAWRNSPEEFTKTLGLIESRIQSRLDFDSDFGPAVNYYRLFLDMASLGGVNKTFWQFMAINALPLSATIPAEVRDNLAPIYRSFPSYTTAVQHARWLAFWYDNAEGEGEVDVLEEIYQTILIGCERCGERLSDSTSYEFLTEIDKPPRNRVFPYWASVITKGLENAHYPEEFISGLWFHVVRKAAIDHPTEMSEAIAAFNERMPDGDPLFVMAYHQINRDPATAATMYKRLIEVGEASYAVYRNLSVVYENLEELEQAIHYEREIDNDPGVQNRTSSSDRIAHLEQKIREKRAREEALKGIERYYQPSPECQINVSALGLTDTLRLIALIEGFVDWKSYRALPINGGHIKWLSAEQDEVATAWLRAGWVYASNKTVGEGIVIESDGARIPNYAQMTLLPNLEPQENWHAQLAILEQHIENLRKKIPPAALEAEVRELLVEDLSDYILARFDAYGIDVHEAARIEQSALECLELFPVGICYGIFYHEIEDAAGKQREDRMTDQHTVNYGLACSRSKAKSARDGNWQLKPYNRERLAGLEAKIVSVIATYFPDIGSNTGGQPGPKRGL